MRGNNHFIAVVLLGAMLAAGCTKNENMEPSTGKPESLKIVATLAQPETRTFLSGTVSDGDATQFTQAWTGNELLYLLNVNVAPKSSETTDTFIFATHTGNLGYADTRSFIFDNCVEKSGFKFGNGNRKIFALISGTTTTTLTSIPNEIKPLFGAWGTGVAKDGKNTIPVLVETNPINVGHITGTTDEKFEWDYMFKAAVGTTPYTKLPSNQTIKGNRQFTVDNGLTEDQIAFNRRNLISEDAMLKFATADYVVTDGKVGTVDLNFKNIVSIIRIPVVVSNALSGNKRLTKVEFNTWEKATTEGNNDHCAGSFKMMLKESGETVIYPYNSSAATSKITCQFSGFGSEGEQNYITLDSDPTYICICVFPRVYHYDETDGGGLTVKFTVDGKEYTKRIKTTLDLTEPAIYNFAPITIGE